MCPSSSGYVSLGEAQGVRDTFLDNPETLFQMVDGRIGGKRLPIIIISPETKKSKWAREYEKDHKIPS